MQIQSKIRQIPSKMTPTKATKRFYIRHANMRILKIRRSAQKLKQSFKMKFRMFPYHIIFSKHAYWWRRTLRYTRPIKSKKSLYKFRKKYPTAKTAKILIRLKRVNTFLTCRTTKKTIYTTSTGTLDFTGKRKGAPFARQSIAKKFMQKLCQKNYRVFDIDFASRIGRLYRMIVKQLVRSRIMLRIIHIKKVHSHGQIRPKKKKRL